MEEAVPVLRRALDMGVGLIDTARVYTDSEEKIGAALHGRSDRPVLVSKTYSRDSEGARRDVETSLDVLGLSSVDVYLLHNINSVELLDEVLGNGGALQGLLRAVAEGAVGFVGISSHKPDVLKEALARNVFDVIEVPFNAIEQESLPVLEEAADRNVGSIVMKPLAGGALQCAGAALRFVLSHPVSCVVPGMQTLQEVAEDLGAAGEMSEVEREEVLAEAEKWKGKFCRRCEYCRPACPNDLNIMMILLFDTYSRRYGMKKWAHERYATMDVRVDSCEQCGKCEERCPYDLPVREMLQAAHEELS